MTNKTSLPRGVRVSDGCIWASIWDRRLKSGRYLGSFDTIEDAEAAYNLAAIEQRDHQLTPLTIAGKYAVVFLTSGQRSIIDADDAERIYKRKWSAHSVKREFSYAKSRYLPLQNFVMNVPMGTMVDHKNGDRLDNRKCNLRITDYFGNARNKRAYSRTGFKGVYEADGRFRAIIKPLGKAINIGSFDSPEEAARAYDTFARKHFGEFAAVNFPVGEERSARMHGEALSNFGSKSC